MLNMLSLFKFKAKILFVFLSVAIGCSGCIRLQGGYFVETPQERKQKTVALDTRRLFEDQKTTGNITT